MKQLFPSLPNPAGLGDVFQAFPETVAPLLDYHDRLLRGDSPLSVAQRELIAAFTSGLNACNYCYNAHLLYAKAFGIAPEQIEAMVADLDTAPVDDNMRPILRYCETLTRTPSKLTEADAKAVYDAGWSERALFDAIQTCALFNLMNRILEGTGITAYPLDPANADETDLHARRTRGYADWGKSIGIMD